MNISELINELKVKEVLILEKQTTAQKTFNNYIKNNSKLLDRFLSHQSKDYNLFITRKEDFTFLEINLLKEKIDSLHLPSSAQVIQECMKFTELPKVEQALLEYIKKYDLVISSYDLLKDLIQLTQEEYPDVPFEEMESCKMIQNNWKLVEKHHQEPNAAEKISEEMIAYSNSLTKNQLGNLKVQEYTINYKHNQGLYFAPLVTLGNLYFKDPNTYIAIYYKAQLKVFEKEELLSLEHYHKILSSVYESDYFKERAKKHSKNF